jgi:hypothetical protein
LQGDLGGWNIELSFVARVVTYIAILGTTSEKKKKKQRREKKEALLYNCLIRLFEEI